MTDQIIDVMSDETFQKICQHGFQNDDELYRISLDNEVNFINWQESIERRLRVLEKHYLNQDIGEIMDMLDA